MRSVHLMGRARAVVKSVKYICFINAVGGIKHNQIYIYGAYICFDLCDGFGAAKQKPQRAVERHTDKVVDSVIKLCMRLLHPINSDFIFF